MVLKGVLGRNVTVVVVPFTTVVSCLPAPYEIPERPRLSIELFAMEREGEVLALELKALFANGEVVKLSLSFKVEFLLPKVFLELVKVESGVGFDLFSSAGWPPVEAMRDFNGVALPVVPDEGRGRVR